MSERKNSQQGNSAGANNSAQSANAPSTAVSKSLRNQPKYQEGIIHYCFDILIINDSDLKNRLDLTVSRHRIKI